MQQLDSLSWRHKMMRALAKGSSVSASMSDPLTSGIGVGVGEGVGKGVGVDLGEGVGDGVDVGEGVGVGVGSASTPPQPASNNTINAKPKVCFNALSPLIVLVLSTLFLPLPPLVLRGGDPPWEI
jgi:hypothetical protein